MSLAEVPAITRSLTAEDLLNMPDDGIERDIIRGELREWPTILEDQESSETTMTRRNPEHSETESLITHYLWAWVKTRPRPRGKVVCGEASFRIGRDPETFVGVDVAYLSAEMVATRDPGRNFYEGPPVLAVEVLSPSDHHQRIVEKVKISLELGAVVWVADPDFRTVAVHRPGELSVTFNESQDLDGEPYLPGFRVRVFQFFED